MIWTLSSFEDQNNLVYDIIIQNTPHYLIIMPQIVQYNLTNSD